jgi:cell division protein FtsI/penicillin-binding protein 2
MSSRARLASILIVVVAAATVVSGCGESDGPDKSLAAAISRLVRALPTGDVSGVAFTAPDAHAQYASAWKPLARYHSAVVVGDVKGADGKDGKATANLNWTTDLSGVVWKHSTTVAFVRAGSLKAGSTWEAIWSQRVLESSLTGNEKIVVTGSKSARGDILGANGQPLVEPRRVFRFGIDKALAASKVPGANLGDSARRVAALLHLGPAPLVKAVIAAGPKAFVEAVVLRQNDVSNKLLGDITAIPGARSIPDMIPLAPSRDFATAILGTVGQATAELIKKSNGVLEVGDETGLSGLELRYNAQLSGTPGVTVSAEVGTGGAAVPRVLFSQEAKPGTALQLSLDQRLQTLAQQLLSRYGPASALVAIRPSTGEILVAASGPGSAGYNTATFGQYAPGSTFKVISSLALLRSGLRPDSAVSCPVSVVVNGKRFKNYSDYPANKFGRITLRQAVANSCNTAFISSRSKVTGTALADAAAALGFGVDHDAGFPAYFGQVPPPAGETEAAADLIGQGKVLASPMAMATVVASVIRASTVVPSLISGMTPIASKPSVPLTAAEAASLRTLMRAVVVEGSGSLLRPPVIAKTGTAEYGAPGPGGALPTHAWMVGGQGDVAVAVFVDQGQSGSHTAGPVLAAFLRAAR